MAPVLLCDLDDTLVDRAATFERWAEQFLSEHGVDAGEAGWLVEEDRRGYRGRPELFRAVKERFALAAAVDDLVDGFYQTFGPMFRCAVEVQEALARLRSEGWRIAIVTNGEPSQLGKIMAAGLPDLVDGWCISAVEGCRKPDPEILRRAAARAGGTLDGAWMIGDSPELDIGAAAAAGIPSVWVAGGRAWPAGLPFAPAGQVRTFAEAVDFVLAWRRAPSR